MTYFQVQNNFLDIIKNILTIQKQSAQMKAEEILSQNENESEILR